MTAYPVRDEPEAETEGSGQNEPNRPVWRLGQNEPPPPAPPQPARSRAVNRGEADKRKKHLEAYQRYKQMREATQPRPHDDGEEERPLKSRRLPAYNQDNRVSQHGTDDWFDDAYGGRQPRVRRARHQRNLARDLTIAGILSVATGLVAGAVVYDRTSNGSVTQAIVSTFDGWNAAAETPPEPAAAKVADNQPIENTAAVENDGKPIVTAALDVADVSGRANDFVPLSLRAEFDEPGRAVGFRLSGLPQAALLTAGVKLNDTTWQLRPGEEKGVRLKLPPGQTQSFVIAVEAIEAASNDLVAPIQEITVAVSQSVEQSVIEPAAAEGPEIERNFNTEVQEQPAAAQPDQAQEELRLPDEAQPGSAVVLEKQTAGQTQVAAAMPIPSPLEEASSGPVTETFSLLRNGDKLMSMGDPMGARQFYLKALNLGDMQAALKVGQTYDPTVFAEMNVQGLKPDPQLALRYYLEARTAGDPGAETAITGLDAWMQR